MSTSREKASPGDLHHHWLLVVLALGCALGAATARAQTAFGAATTIVFPVVASTSTFTGEVTLYNPNATDVTVGLNYYDANGLAAPGTKPCNDVLLPANESVQFTVASQCTLGPGSHFGLLAVSDLAFTHSVFGYSRTQNNAGAGFSIEGFPVSNFTMDTAYVAGLKRSAAPPTYQTNCFVGSLSDPVTYDLSLYDDSTGTQVGSTVSGSLGAWELVRYLDIFSVAGAAAGDYANVRAQFTRTSAGTQQMLGFCTVQDNVSFGADFRIAKSVLPAAVPVATVPWAGPMITLFSNTLTYIFVGPTATVNLAGTASVSAYGTGTFARQTGSPITISIGVCYQDQSGPGAVTPMGLPLSTHVSTIPLPYGVAGSTSLGAGVYNVGYCAQNNNAGAVNKNGNTSGFVIITS